MRIESPNNLHQSLDNELMWLAEKVAAAVRDLDKRIQELQEEGLFRDKLCDRPPRGLIDIRSFISVLGSDEYDE
jgi:hypothetical protein